MKKHFEYLGYGRSGSTFLYYMLKEHSYFKNLFSKLRKENTLLFDGKSICDYMSVYSPYKYSINMCTHTRLLNSNQLIELDKVTDKFFFLIRNPYEYIKSVVRYTNNIQYPDVFSLQNSLDYTRTINRCQTVLSKPVKVFIFDDLVGQTDTFMEKLFDYLEIPYENLLNDNACRNSSEFFVYNSTSKSVELKTDNNYIEVTFSKELIIILNNYIDEFSTYMNRDFSSWKR